jgi:SAM-dependent methyltransferase
MTQSCEVCQSGSLMREPLVVVEDVPYHQCDSCGSILVPDSHKFDLQRSQKYDAAYWEFETRSSQERSFGSTICRIAETILYCRVPINDFIDIGCGPGYTLDAVATLLPKYVDRFTGVELNPPPPEYRTNNKNYKIGSVGDLPNTFQAGICIEVIEHLSPSILEKLVEELAAKSLPGSLYYFNSSQPEKVIRDEYEYLDPYSRGHIASYSLKGLSSLFGRHNFSIIPLFGRDWAFLAEYNTDQAERVDKADQLLQRVWTPCQENKDILTNGGFGPVMYTMAIESARCYVEHAIKDERTQWALDLKRRLDPHLNE